MMKQTKNNNKYQFFVLTNSLLFHNPLLHKTDLTIIETNENYLISLDTGPPRLFEPFLITVFQSLHRLNKSISLFAIRMPFCILVIIKYSFSLDNHSKIIYRYISFYFEVSNYFGLEILIIPKWFSIVIN